jgi:hypothetical protein
MAFPTLAVETVTLVQEVWNFSGRLFCTTCGLKGSLVLKDVKDQFGYVKAFDTITESWYS